MTLQEAAQELMKRAERETDRPRPVGERGPETADRLRDARGTVAWLERFLEEG